MDKISPRTEELIVRAMKDYKITYDEVVKKSLIAYRYLRDNVVDKERELFVLKENGLLQRVHIKGK